MHGRQTSNASQVRNALFNRVDPARWPSTTTKVSVKLKGSFIQTRAFLGGVERIVGVPVRVELQEFPVNFLNCAVELDKRSSWGHFNFPFRDRDLVTINGGRECRDPELRMLVDTCSLGEKGYLR